MAEVLDFLIGNSILECEAVELVALCSTCKTLVSHLHSDEQWMRLSVAKFGAPFWILASRQPTRPWRDALRRVYLFEDALRAHGLPMWSHREYFLYWKAKYPQLYR